jgi:hypothetical protein
MTDTNPNTALSWTGSVCSIVGLIAVIALQKFEFTNYTLLFWWLTSVLIAIAAVNTCFVAPSFALRAIFAIIFVAQIPAFDWAWGELHERDTMFSLQLLDEDQNGELTRPPEKERIDKLEQENSILRAQLTDTFLFWRSMSHLTGMAFALLACTAAGQQRIRIVYDHN